MRRLHVPSPSALASFPPSPPLVEPPAWQQLQTLKSLKIINDQEDQRCDDLCLKHDRSRTSQSTRHGQRYGAADAGEGGRRGLTAGVALARSVSPVVMSRRISHNINSRILKPLGSARCQESRINPFQVQAVGLTHCALPRTVCIREHLCNISRNLRALGALKVSPLNPECRQRGRAGLDPRLHVPPCL